MIALKKFSPTIKITITGGFLMQGRKIFIGAILFMALCLSACEKNPSEIAEAESVSTASETVMDSGTETFSAAETEVSEKGTETEASETEQTKPEKFSEKDIENYFAEHGYKWEKIGSYVYVDGELYVDMDNFSDGTEPLDGLDKEYLDRVRYLVIQNIKTADLSFISKCENVYSWGITLENYSGSCDLSILKGSTLYLDNYTGGDLSSVKDSKFDSIIFANYDGKSDLSCISDYKNTYYLGFRKYSPDTDFSFAEKCDNITYLSLTDYSLETDVSFLAGCKHLISLALCNKSIDAEKLAEILKNSDIGNLYVKVVDYSSADAELLMKAAPTCTISYNLDDSPWFGADGSPTEGIVFFANLYVAPSSTEEKWECQTSKAQAYYPGTWRYHGSLVSTFTNFTEEKQPVKSVQIFHDEGGKLTEMPFADGSKTLEIDFTINPNENSDFDITEEMFPFSKCETGIYKVIFDLGDEKLEQTFFIKNSDMSFLTDEQKEIFDKAYDITRGRFGESTYMSLEYIENHTTEEFLATLYEGYTKDYAYNRAVGWGYIDENGNLQECYGDRCGDISQQGECFELIYSDENEVIFKNTVIHGHEDYPYFIWFEELNYHMVKTEDGWWFDNFQLWY